MAVITISRRTGSGAEEIASRLCEELGLLVFDKHLMMQVAAEIGLTETEIIDYSEDRYKLRSFLEALFRTSRPVGEVSSRTGGGLAGYEREARILDEREAVTLIRATVTAAYERGNVLVFGRGGQAILEDKPGVVHVRIVAPLEDRVQRVQNVAGVTAAQARRFIAERDRATAEYLRIFHYIDWDDPTLYHLVLNSGKLGIDKCVELIKMAVR